MNAAAHFAIDDGPRHAYVTMNWDICGRSGVLYQLRATYRVTWPSLKHRCLGLEMQVVIDRVEHEVEHCWKDAQLTKAQHAAVLAEIEHEEELRMLDGAEA